jgi:ribosomal protein L35
LFFTDSRKFKTRQLGAQHVLQKVKYCTCGLHTRHLENLTLVHYSDIKRRKQLESPASNINGQKLIGAYKFNCSAVTLRQRATRKCMWARADAAPKYPA